MHRERPSFPMEDKKRFVKPESREHTKFLKSERRGLDWPDNILGGRLLHLLFLRPQNSEERNPEMEQSIDKESSKVNRLLRKRARYLLEGLEKPDRGEDSRISAKDITLGFHILFNDARKLESIKMILDQKIREYRIMEPKYSDEEVYSDEFIFINLVPNLESHTLSNLAVVHAREHLIKEREFFENIEDYVNLFKEIVFNKYRQAKTGINRRTTEKRMKNIRYVLADPLLYGLFDKGGQFSATTNTIFVYRGLDPAKEKKVFCHELAHAVSGKTIMTTNGNSERPTTSGLRVGTRILKTPPKDKGRFNWLNEALTEELILASHAYDFPMKQPFTKQDPFSYRNERFLLYSILRRQKSEKINLKRLFYNAYFENYDPSQSPEERIKHWKELIATTNKVFGNNFLLNLDKYVTKHGSRKAAMAINKNMKAFLEKLPQISGI